jgi:hypothetical protein
VRIKRLEGLTLVVAPPFGKVTTYSLPVYTRHAVSAPGGGASTSQGHPYAIFRRALERKNLLVAEATAKELPPLTMLIARKDPRRHPRVAARWLLRYLEECDDATIDEAAMVAACLAALSGDRHRDAALTHFGPWPKERLVDGGLEA